MEFDSGVLEICDGPVNALAFSDRKAEGTFAINVTTQGARVADP
jgi:hypothetical protein